MITLDKDVIKAYYDDKLWKDQDFYVSLLEHMVCQPNNTNVQGYVQNLVLARQKFVIASVMKDDGSVSVKIKPWWANICQRLLRYSPWYHGPRIED